MIERSDAASDKKISYIVRMKTAHELAQTDINSDSGEDAHRCGYHSETNETQPKTVKFTFNIAFLNDHLISRNATSRKSSLTADK